MVQIVIFDLDGTLLDTIGDLAVACNAVLEQHGYPTHEMDDYRQFVGNGIMRLVERAMPEAERTPEKIAAVRADFITYYTAHIDERTTPYRGIMGLLEELQKREIAIAVASNKFQDGTRKLVKSFFPQIRFSAVLGQRPEVPLKPSPAIVREVLQITSYTPDKVMFVGDSGIDMQTAKAAAVKSVGVTWGFRTREELEASGANYIIDSPEEFLKLLD